MSPIRREKIALAMALALCRKIRIFTVVDQLFSHSRLPGGGEGLDTNMILCLRLDQLLALIAHNWVDGTHAETESTLLHSALTVCVVVGGEEGVRLSCAANLRLALCVQGFFHGVVLGGGSHESAHGARLDDLLH